MKRNASPVCLLLVLFVLLPVILHAQVPQYLLKWRKGMDEAGTEVRVGERYPLPTQNMPLAAFTATQTFDVGTSAAKLIPTLAATTRAILVGSTVGDVNFGNANVPTGTGFPFKIASGSYLEFPVSTTTPALYLRGQTATCPVFILEK